MLSNLDDLESLFKKMNNEGFDTSLELRWGFYFVDPNRDKLETIFSELSDKGYCLEKIYKADSNDSFWTIHVSKVDILTAEQLYKRNLAFNELAIYCQVELYDGWDVEKL
jgi:hypothetical protein